MTAEPRPSVMGREMLLASAGSGKTYQLSSRLIGLLAMGVPPEEILASTFTRKAAGEIIDRVLMRIAEGAVDGKAAEELAAAMPREVPAGRLDREEWGELLIRTVRGLHRLQVHTLDAFFHRVAHSFAQELGLPERWTVADTPDRERLRARAIEATLDEIDRSVLLEMVRLVSRGGGDRDVQRLLTEAVDDLHDIYREIDPDAEMPWGFAGGAKHFETVDDVAVDALIRAFEGASLPRNKDGTEDVRWVAAREKGLAQLRARDWEGVVTSGIGAALVQGSGSYYKKPIPTELEALAPALIRGARAALGAELHRRIAALGRFLPEYDVRLRRLAKREGIYGFEDLTHALVEGGGLGQREELYYRLDGRIQHVLLDEFQDTSNAQWAALEPLVGEILSGHESDRAAFVVADPKQSIYGWRGGEPRLLERITAQYGLEPATIASNWRSSQIVLDSVNRVFGDIAAHPLLEEDRAVAERWAASFQPHTAKRSLPGYFRVEVGPDAEERAQLRPRGLAHAAELTAALHGEAPGASIGLLTLTNKNAAYLIASLRRLGIEASEEGGVPIADSAPVLALLALLRMADHPGDRIARYLVAHTPVSWVADFASDRWEDDAYAARIAQQIRERLLREGYGAVVSEWVRALEPAQSPRDRTRLRQLSERAFAWDARATLRPADFVRSVEAARAEDPASAAVRVMTVYRAKGLEFDAIVLADLAELSLTGGRGETFLPYRPGGAGLVARVLPGIRKELQPLFPEVDEAAAQARERSVRDGLSALYVAVTRARHGVYVVVPPDESGTSKARNGARILTTVLAPEARVVEGTTLYEVGEPEWWRDASFEGRLERPLSGAADLRARSVPRKLRLATAPRRRLLSREAPSGLEGGGRVSLTAILDPQGGGGALDVGTVLHRWLEAIGWIEDGVPERDVLLEMARECAPAFSRPESLVDPFLAWIEHPALRSLLSKAAHPPGTRVDRELPFVARDGNRLLQGVVDRVLWIPDPAGERIVAIDWKTDGLPEGDADALETRVAFYRPQIEAYLRALARITGTPSERVSGRLAFLRGGSVQEVPFQER